MDRCDLRLVQAHRDELGQAAPFPDDPECPVLGVDQGDRCLDDLPQHDLQLQVAADGDDRLQQCVHAVSGPNRSSQPDLQLGQQVIEPQVREQRPALSRFHEGGLPFPG